MRDFGIKNRYPLFYFRILIFKWSLRKIFNARKKTEDITWKIHWFTWLNGSAASWHSTSLRRQSSSFTRYWAAPARTPSSSLRKSLRTTGSSVLMTFRRCNGLQSGLGKNRSQTQNRYRSGELRWRKPRVQTLQTDRRKTQPNLQIPYPTTCRVQKLWWRCKPYYSLRSFL